MQELDVCLVLAIFNRLVDLIPFALGDGNELIHVCLVIVSTGKNACALQGISCRLVFNGVPRELVRSTHLG